MRPGVNTLPQPILLVTVLHKLQVTAICTTNHATGHYRYHSQYNRSPPPLAPSELLIASAINSHLHNQSDCRRNHYCFRDLGIMKPLSCFLHLGCFDAIGDWYSVVFCLQGRVRVLKRKYGGACKLRCPF
jgi:hypothetical protein